MQRERAGRGRSTTKVSPDLRDPVQFGLMAQGLSDRYRSLVAGLKDIVLFIRADGSILDGNDAALKAYGYSLEQLRKMSTADLRARGTWEEVTRQYERALAEGLTFETTHRRSNGELFPVEVNAVGTRWLGELVLLTIIRDLSTSRRRERLAEMQFELDHLLVRAPSASDFLHRACERLAEIFRLSVVTVSLKGLDGRMRPAAGFGEQYLKPAGAFFTPCDQDDCPVCSSVVTGRGGIGRFEDLAEGDVKRAALEAGLRSYAVFPLAVKQEPVGVLTVASGRTELLDDESLADLREAAHQVTVGLMSERHAEEGRLREAALEAAANAVLITNKDGQVVWVNPAFTRITGYSREESVGQTPRFLKSGVHGEQVYKGLWSTITAGMVWRGEMVNRRKDGTLYVEEMTVTPVKSSRGEIDHFIAIKQDITDRRRTEDRLEFLTRHDPVTGLPNRRGLEERVQVAVEMARMGIPAGLMVLAVDHFELINEVLGLAAAEQVLVQIAGLLRNALRPDVFLARLATNEIAVVAPSLTPDETVSLARELVRIVATATFPEQLSGPPITLSAGIVPIDGGIKAADLLTRAIAAVASATERGHNQVVLLMPDGGVDEAMGRWGRLLTDALANGRFVLHFQPVKRLGTGGCEHVEALLRMRMPDGQLALPGQFLGPAEHLYLMPQLDRWVVSEVIQTLRRRPNLRVFVNLSGQSLADQRLLSDIESWVTAAGPEVTARLTFEVTETVVVRDLAGARQWMSRLTEQGCSFALDDFGSGFASFAYLRTLPTDYVKLDGTLVKALLSDHQSRAMVQAISSVVHALDKKVVAEWIEEPEVAHYLLAIGVEFGQGFALGKPSPDLDGLGIE